MMHFKIRPIMQQVINSTAFKKNNIPDGTSPSQLTVSQFMTMKGLDKHVETKEDLENLKKHFTERLNELENKYVRKEELKQTLQQTQQNHPMLNAVPHMEKIQSNIRREMDDRQRETMNAVKESFAQINENMRKVLEENNNNISPDQIRNIILEHITSNAVDINGTSIKEGIEKFILDIRKDLSDELDNTNDNIEDYLQNGLNNLQTYIDDQVKLQNRDIVLHINEEMNDLYNYLETEIQSINESLNNRLLNVRDGMNGLTVYSFEKVDDKTNTISLETTHSIIERYNNNTLVLPTPETYGVYKVLSLANNSVPFHLIKTNRATLLLERQPITLYFDGEKWCNIEEAKWLPLTQFGEKITGTNQCELGTSMDLNTDGTILVVGCPKANDGVGEILVYQRDIKGWNLSDKIVGANNIGKSRQGTFVKFTLDSNKIIVGGPGDNEDTGAIWIFSIKDVKTKENGELERIWTSEKLVAENSIKGSLQGSCIAVSRDNQIAVGASKEPTGGCVYVYKQESDGMWSELRIDNPHTADTHANFGCSLSFNAAGNLLSIGADNDTDGRGCVYIYKREKDDFKMFLEVVGGNYEGETVNMGNSVCLSPDGRFLSFGGKSDSFNMGAVWVYRIHNDKVVSICDKLTASNYKGMYISFGSSVNNNGNNVLYVGSSDDDNGTGAIYAYIFDKELGEMIQIEKIIGRDISKGSFQGNMISISLDGRTLVSSGCVDDNNNGSVWTFS